MQANKNIEIKPDYYEQFQCSAKACPITCCQQWKIAVDEDTYCKWQQLTADLKGDAVNLASCVCGQEETRIIQLNAQKQCPFLNENKLCSLVIQFGDSVLSKTCAVFPRQVQEFADRTEYSLAACCPQVIDILYRRHKVCFQPNFNQISLLPGTDGILFQIRSFFIDLMQDETYSAAKAFKMCFYLLLDMLEQEIQEFEGSTKGYSKGVLQELSNAMDKLTVDVLDTFDERNELFLDLAQNYRKEHLYTHYLEDIAVLAQQYTKTYDADNMRLNLRLFEEQAVRYQTLFRNYLISEVYAGLLPDACLQDMAAAFQWIGMEYAAIRQAVFLKWILSGAGMLEYTDVRALMVILARMTGYDEADKVEYLENSFENLIWDWGYFALIVG